jgi:hypothetical protein
MVFYSVTIFLSAFLLFAVQPVIGKMILPWFGGTSAVWSTCMLFFQAVLLLGYLYAHWLFRRLSPRIQFFAHAGALAISLVALPILPNPAWKAGGVDHPSLRILALLAVTVGMPYLVLSSTSPLLQAWYARSHKEGLPYRLFALSNFASMLALLSYPSLIEPNLPTRTQGITWSAGYVVFAIFCGITAWRARREPAAARDAPAEVGDADVSPPGRKDRLFWLGLAAAASILLLAVTTHLTQDVAAIPFLWILPLSVYLLSFIICFEAPRLYHRLVFLPLLIAALGFMAQRLSTDRVTMGIRPTVALFAGSLFVCCMVCHGELSRLKPHPRFLTGFYVLVSLGGVLGGVFVGLVAPNVFRAYYELPIGLLFCAVIVLLLLAREAVPAPDSAKAWGVAALAVALAWYVWSVGDVMRVMVRGYSIVVRNFYGQLRVSDGGDPETDSFAVRRFVHGVINHGEQALREEYRRRPITYFCEESGIGRAMLVHDGGPRRIGVLGLGCGTLAAYGKAGDTMRIYEINPLVLDVANRQFTYLRDTPARVEIALGDARLLLEAEPSQQFDVLVMDAFSGDSVPVHLITREAFLTYFRHLKPGGILAVNISNQYLNLEPVMGRAADALGKIALVYHYEPTSDDPLCFGCSWALIMDRAKADSHPELLADAKVLRPQGAFRLWTDDFSNMYQILK